MSRGSSLQESGKAAAMGRGSSPAGKAAVILRHRVETDSGETRVFGDEGHQKCVNSPVEDKQSFCSTLIPGIL